MSEEASEKFAYAESVETLAKGIIPQFHTNLINARILYLFVDKTPSQNGKPVFGKATKASPLVSFLKNIDFVVETYPAYWNDMDLDTRQALVDHLLSYCDAEENEKTGALKWVIRKPDVAEFSQILARHGAWRPELQEMCSIAKDIDLDSLVGDSGDEVQDLTVDG